jgi:protoheme IX farnesyltransferase
MRVTAFAGSGRVADFVELTKPNIVVFILATVTAGFYLGSRGSMAVTTLVHTLIGSALVAAGSNALNQTSESALFAWALGIVGVGYLLAFTNPIVALLAAATLGSYVFVYTPLKRLTSLSTLVGAIPGALPIVGGWAAATGALTLEAWVLFAILFLWQLPHFLALAWLYREDYARAGLRMLSVTDGADATFRQALLYAVALLPVSLTLTVLGTTGLVYFIGAAVMGILVIAATAAVAVDHAARKARRLFLVTIVYLPLLLGLMVVDKT